MPTLVELGIHAQRFAPPQIADTFTKTYCNRMGKSRKLSDKIQFAKDYAIDYRKTRKCSKTDSMESCLAKFPTLNDFFTRELKPEYLKIQSRQTGAIICPAECMARRVSLAGGAFDIKGSSYTLVTLLRSKSVPSKAAVFVFRLAPEHYHRIHSPTTSRITQIKTVGGHYRSVNPILLNRQPVLQENYRKIITFSNGMILVAVGATCVGSIDLSVQKGDIVNVGQDLGAFKFGGSCLVLIVPGTVRSTLTSEERYKRVGSVVGTITS
jgi:phosphatidylserine decarboxylase